MSYRSQIKCPKCRREVTIIVDERIKKDAATNPLGLASIVIPHGDHAIVVYIDSKGHIQNIRYFMAFSKDFAVTKYRETTIKRDLLFDVVNISSLKLSIPKLNLIIKAIIEEKDYYIIGRTPNLILELSFNSLDNGVYVANWMPLLIKAFDRSLPYLNTNSIIELIRWLDRRIYTYPSPLCELIMYFILSSRSLKIKIVPEIFNLYLKKLASTHPLNTNERMMQILALNGRILAEIFKPLEGYDEKLIASIASLYMRGVIETEVVT